MSTAIRIATAIFIVILSGVVRLEAQKQPQLIDSMSGADTYAQYCAGCHGPGGRADGAVAPTLKAAPPDLTRIAERNGGAFPRERVRSAITNTDRPIAAHGTGEMPAWGHIFRALDPSDARVQVRIDNVVAFVETLQRPVAGSAEAGRAVFAAYCANCHGPRGTGGDGPDLTTFALRNGGMFPSRRLAQIIDGRGVSSHLRGNMPVWGVVFQARPGAADAAAAAARIEAVTRYLELLQVQRG